MRKILTAAAAALLLAACGGEDETGDAALSPPTSSPTKSAPSTQSTAPAPSPTAPMSQPASPHPSEPASAEEEERLVTAVVGRVFTDHEEALSDALVKSNPLIEAETEFRFDAPSRTVVLAVTSVSDTGSPGVAYGLATDFAPVFWQPEGTNVVRPGALPFFSVTVDDSAYLCDGPTMVALVGRELSEEMFVQQCSA